MFTVLVLILISILMTTVSVLTLLSWGQIFKKILRYSSVFHKFVVNIS